MGYSQNPLNVLKGQMTNKAVGLAHGDSMALQSTDPKDGTKSVKMKDLPLRSKARYEEYRKRGWKQDETSLGRVGADNKIDLRDWQESGKSEDIQRRMPRT
jgi:hypothetical protein